MKIGEMPQTSDISKNGYLIYSDDGVDSQKAGIDDAMKLISSLYSEELATYKQENPYENSVLTYWNSNANLLKEINNVDIEYERDRLYSYDPYGPKRPTPIWTSMGDERHHRYTPGISIKDFYEMYVPMIMTYNPEYDLRPTPLGLVCPDYFFENPARVFTMQDLYYFFLPVTYETRIDGTELKHWAESPESTPETPVELPPTTSIIWNLLGYVYIPYIYDMFPVVYEILSASCSFSDHWAYKLDIPGGTLYQILNNFEISYSSEREIIHNEHETSDKTGDDAKLAYEDILNNNRIYMSLRSERIDLGPFSEVPLNSIIFENEEVAQLFNLLFESPTLKNQIMSFDVLKVYSESKSVHSVHNYQEETWFKDLRHDVLVSASHYYLYDESSARYDYANKTERRATWIEENAPFCWLWENRDPQQGIDPTQTPLNPTGFGLISIYKAGATFNNGELVISEFGKDLAYSHIANPSRFEIPTYFRVLAKIPPEADSTPDHWSNYMRSIYGNPPNRMFTSMILNAYYYKNDVYVDEFQTSIRDIITLNNDSYFDKIVNEVLNGGRIISDILIDGHSVKYGDPLQHQKVVARIEDYSLLTTPNVYFSSWYDEETHKTIWGIRVRNTVLQRYPGAKVVNGSIRNRVISGESDVSDVGVDGTSVVTNKVANINFYSATKTKETHLVTDSSCAIDISEQKVVEGPCRTTVEYTANLKPTPNNVILEDHITSERITFNKSNQPFYSSYFYQYFNYNSAVLISDAIVIFPVDCTIIMFYDDMFHKTGRVPFYPFDSHFNDYTVKKVTANVPTKLRLIKTLPADNNVRVPTSPAAVYGLGFITDIPSSSSIDPNDVKIYSKYKIKHFVNT